MENIELTTVSFTPANHLSGFHPIAPFQLGKQISMLDLAGGLELICAALTVLYIVSLLTEGGALRNQMSLASNVIKTSLQGQQVTRRLR